RIEELPNCQHLGALSKRELYSAMLASDVWAYPTQFEEVSCITAMECMGAGLHLMTNSVGALPETIADYQNSTMFGLSENGESQNDRFVAALAEFQPRERTPDRRYTWDRVADEIEEAIEKEFVKCRKNRDTLARHFLRNSDVASLRLLIDQD